MELKCTYPNCPSHFYFSGRGRVPHYCIPHRLHINRLRAAEWHRTHYRSRSNGMGGMDPESIVRPMKSYLFAGPGLFNSTDELFNKALDWKARTLNQSKEYVRTQWIHGQAGREFIQSFMHPDHC